VRSDCTVEVRFLTPCLRKAAAARPCEHLAAVDARESGSYRRFSWVLVSGVRKVLLLLEQAGMVTREFLELAAQSKGRNDRLSPEERRELGKRAKESLERRFTDPPPARATAGDIFWRDR